MLHQAFVVGLPLFLCAAAVSDVRHRQIPNLLTGGMALVGVMLSLADGGLARTWPGVWAGVVALLIGLVLQLARLVGGGDVKLFAALAIWLGAKGSMDAALATAIAGGVLALFFLRRPSSLGDDVRSDGPLMSRLQLDEDRDFERVPYGVAVAAGGMWVWWSHLGTPGGWS
jgi:prepilin peptidase CpaA